MQTTWPQKLIILYHEHVLIFLNQVVLSTRCCRPGPVLVGELLWNFYCQVPIKGTSSRVWLQSAHRNRAAEGLWSRLGFALQSCGSLPVCVFSLRCKCLWPSPWNISHFLKNKCLDFIFSMTPEVVSKCCMISSTINKGCSCQGIVLGKTGVTQLIWKNK